MLHQAYFQILDLIHPYMRWFEKIRANMTKKTDLKAEERFAP